MIIARKPRVVVLGGGFGGLETAFYLRQRLGDRASIALVSDRDRFIFKPNSIYVPFGMDPEKLSIPLHGAVRRQDIVFVHATADSIDPVDQTIHTTSGVMPYDFLVVATGAGMRPGEIPGLGEFARTIWTPDEMLALRADFETLLADARRNVRRRVLFLVPPQNRCAGPLYELAFMLDSWLREKKARDQVDIAWATVESGYIQAFGPRLDDYVTGEFERRRIEGHKRLIIERVEEKRAFFRGGDSLPFDLLVSFPPYVAATRFADLPSDERGFLRTLPDSRQVEGIPDIYAVGDAADFPIKQAFLAFLQADAAAEDIAGRILRTEPRSVFEPMGMCVMEQFDKATFAQVPLRLTALPDRPIEVLADDPAYRVGSSAAWRLGKKLLGAYLPWRFRAGKPFHAGLPWAGMDAGLRVMSHVLATPPAHER
jgi:NADH dehydrogenase FAD-containing subunit